MKTISIVNLKGGVGKTVTAVNLAGILAGDYGKQVLLIDADPQANTTRFFGFDGDCDTIADIMRGEVTGDIEDYVYQTGLDRVCLVPSEIALIEADIHSVQGSNAGEALRLHNFLSAVETDGVSLYDDAVTQFDYCIIDCPPSFTAASVAAIYASDEVIIPVKIDAFALDGLRELRKQIDGMRFIKPGITIAGALITMWHNCPAVIQGEELLRKAGTPPVFRTIIRRSDKVDESTFAGQTLAEYSRGSSAGRDYRKFVAEWLEEASI